MGLHLYNCGSVSLCPFPSVWRYRNISQMINCTLRFKTDLYFVVPFSGKTKTTGMYSDKGIVPQSHKWVSFYVRIDPKYIYVCVYLFYLVYKVKTHTNKKYTNILIWEDVSVITVTQQVYRGEQSNDNRRKRVWRRLRTESETA